MERTIRDLINSNGHMLYQKYFKRKWVQWNKLCSAMDIVGDTSLAIEWYLSKGMGSSDGEKYLKLYGLLQAIYLQQDAITALQDVVSILASEKKINIKGLKKQKTKKWNELRSYRNLSIGHPIECKSYEKGEINRAFISRVTMSDQGFQLSSNRDKQKDTRFEYVDIKELVAGYKKEAKENLKGPEQILAKVLKILIKE